MKFTVSANLRKISVITAELQQIKTKVRFSYHYPIILLQHSCTWIHTAHSCHGRTDNNRKTQESQDKADGKQTLVPQKANTVCLCADDVLTREKLSAYHDSYAEAMAKYGLQRGIRGSEARHTTTAQYYRDLKRQTGELETNVRQLQTERQQAKQELDEVRKEIKSEKLEAAKAEVKTALVAKVGSLFGGSKQKEFEHKNEDLQNRMQELEKEACNEKNNMPNKYRK